MSGPVGTCFWHDGGFGAGEDGIAALRTTAQKYDELEAFFVDQHEWSCPEIAGIVLARMLTTYAAWCSASRANSSRTGARLRYGASQERHRHRPLPLLRRWPHP